MGADKKEVATDVVKPQSTEIALADYEQYAGSGFENQNSEDYSIPFLQVLQAISPQVIENEALRPGQIFNTVTGEVFDSKTGVAFIPATTEHKFVEWTPRESGNQFVGTHEIDSELVKSCKANQEFGKFKTPEGNDLVESFYVYGIAIDADGNTCQAVISFSSTKIKKYKAWMTKAKTIQIALTDGRRIPAPLFAHRYRLKTVSEKNTKGTFYNLDIAFDGANAIEARLAPKDPLFQDAVAIKQLLESGKARAAYESQAPGSADVESETSGAPSGKPVF